MYTVAVVKIFKYINYAFSICDKCKVGKFSFESQPLTLLSIWATGVRKLVLVHVACEVGIILDKRCVVLIVNVTDVLISSTKSSNQWN